MNILKRTSTQVGKLILSSSFSSHGYKRSSSILQNRFYSSEVQKQKKSFTGIVGNVFGVAILLGGAYGVYRLYNGYALTIGKLQEWLTLGKQKSEEIVHTGKEKIGEITEKGKEKMGNVAEYGKDKMEKGKEKMGEWKQKGEEGIQKGKERLSKLRGKGGKEGENSTKDES